MLKQQHLRPEDRWAAAAMPLRLANRCPLIHCTHRLLLDVHNLAFNAGSARGVCRMSRMQRYLAYLNEVYTQPVYRDLKPKNILINADWAQRANRFRTVEGIPTPPSRVNY